MVQLRYGSFDAALVILEDNDWVGFLVGCGQTMATRLWRGVGMEAGGVGAAVALGIKKIGRRSAQLEVTTAPSKDLVGVRKGNISYL